MTTMVLRSARARGWMVLAGVLVLGVALLWGLVIFVWSLLANTGPVKTVGHPGVPPRVTTFPSRPLRPSSWSTRSFLRSAENALAAQSMLPVAPADALPQPITTSTAGAPLRLPKPTSTTGFVRTGYPHAPEGAVAQLAAIDAAALKDLNPMSPRHAYDWAALPGATPFAQWTPHVGVSAILTAADAPDGSSELTSTWTLTHAQIKGTLDHGNFVVACVLGELDASYRSSVRAGVADCQRMLWDQGRWWIGPGVQPAFGPSTWPGSPECVRAGWREVANA